MNEKQKVIAWSRWIDAYGLNRNQLEYVPEKEIVESNGSFDINPDDRYEFDEEDECEHDNQEASPVIVTPTGILPLKPFNNILNFYNFWLGETNFNISEDVIPIINNTDGVEILDILGRYKFRVAIGNCFKFQDVRQDIERQLGITYDEKVGEAESEANMELDDNLKEQVKDIYRIHLKKHPFWAVLVLPNQKIDIALADSQTAEFDEKVETYMKSKSMTGGAVFKSWEKKHLQSLGLG